MKLGAAPFQRLGLPKLPCLVLLISINLEPQRWCLFCD